METKKVGWLDAADQPSPNVGKIGERGHRERRRTRCMSLISLLEWRKSKRKARERQSGTSFVTHSPLTHHFPANRASRCHEQACPKNSSIKQSLMMESSYSFSSSLY